MRWQVLVWIFLLAGYGEDTTKPKIPDPGVPVTDNDTDPEGHPITLIRTDIIAGATITHDAIHP